MKTWNELNAELNLELEKENPNENKLEDIYLQMLKASDYNSNLYSPYDRYINYSKVILAAFVLSLIAFAIFT